MKLKDQFDTLKQVYKNKLYIFLTILFAVFFFSINSLIHNFQTISSNLSASGLLSTISLFIKLSFGLHASIKVHSYIPLIILSILFGILISLIIYKTKLSAPKTDKKTGIIAGAGIFLAAFVPGCTVCGVGLISALGLSASVISFLPLHGLEISYLSIFLILLAIHLSLKNMYLCKSKLKNVKGGTNNEKER